MKPYNKLSKYRAAAALGLMGLLLSCKDALDVPGRRAIAPELVWTDPMMIKAFLSDIYSVLTPTWVFNGGISDEAVDRKKNLSEYQLGIVSDTRTNSSLDYGSIEKINFFLDKLETIPPSVLSDALKKQYTGEALFWRAWAYWKMVKQLGGVPLILKPQNAEEINSLFVPRNKTSECVAQMTKDLDRAISLLPAVYAHEAADYGRITKIAAMAVKGRILMTYASPLFNPDRAADRWLAAYDANKAAHDAGIAAGNGLHPKFQELWTKERNAEVIMVNQYSYPNHTINFSLVRPQPLTLTGLNINQPSFSLLMSFPKKDGSPMQFDKARLANDADYNTQFMNDFYANRDDRFYATVYFGGTPYPSPDEFPPSYIKGYSLWNVWKYDVKTKTFLNILYAINAGLFHDPGLTGFFQLKGVDTSLDRSLAARGQTDWIEIRFAEVKMNYAECANEIGHKSEAIDRIKEIRKRAGIASGAGNYGITADSQEEIREALIAERQAEFAFENKRFDDLRRWKRYDILNKQGTRRGLYITLKDPANLPAPSDNIMTPSVRDKFKACYIESLDDDETYVFKLDLNHWFYALPPSQISQSKNILLQNKEYAGSFDPLQ